MVTLVYQKAFDKLPAATNYIASMINSYKPSNIGFKIRLLHTILTN